MELTEVDFKEMVPGKIGIVKKLIRVQKTVFIIMYVVICAL